MGITLLQSPCSLKGQSWVLSWPVNHNPPPVWEMFDGTIIWNDWFHMNTVFYTVRSECIMRSRLLIDFGFMVHLVELHTGSVMKELCSLLSLFILYFFFPSFLGPSNLCTVRSLRRALQRQDQQIRVCGLCWHSEELRRSQPTQS